MEVKFAEYRFLRDQLILYKHDEIVPLKHTQALLLDYFLTQPSGIHSKDAIMSSVWKDKVVSEQVVFQTISQLRAIFGSHAIKTFSKKGYQWQIAIEEAVPALDDSAQENQTLDSQAAEITSSRAKSISYSLWLAIAFFGLVLAGGYFLLPQSTEKLSINLVQKTTVSQSPIDDFSTLAKQAIDGQGAFSTKLVSPVHSARQAFAAPKLTWQQSKLPNNEWLLWSESFSSPKGIFLDYGLSKGTMHWRGYLFGKTKEQLASKLAKRLAELNQLALFSNDNQKLDISSLTSMLKEAPEDADLLLQLAEYYLEVKQYEVAITYANKLITLDDSYSFTPYRAKGLWLTAEAYKQRRKYDLANNTLNEMAATLQDTPLRALTYDYFHAKAWVLRSLDDFDKVFEVLDQGLDYSLKHDDPLMLFELHITYSILAKKAGDDHKKYAHLNEAQSLLLRHNLHESNFAVVYYHFAIFTKDKAKELPYLEKILTLPRTARNGWIIDDAIEKVIDQYIVDKKYEQAISLLNEQQSESAKYMFSWAKIYQATNEHQQARSYFEKAFELARLDYDAHIGSHAAFALYAMSMQQPERQAEYLDYLERNASKQWLNEQMSHLH